MASLPLSQQPKRRRLSLIPLALSRADSTKANTPVEHNLQSNISLTSGSSDVPPHSPTSKSSPKGISHFRRQSITQSIRRMSLSLTGQNLRSPSESNLGPTSPIYSLASPMSSSSPTTPIARTNMWGLPGRSAADRLRSLVSASTKASDSSAQFVKLRPQSPSSEREEDDLPEYLHGMRSEAETRPKATDESKPDPIRMSRSQHFRHQSLAKLTRTSEERPEQIEVDPPVEGTMTSTSIPIMLDHVKATTRRSSLSTLTSRLSTQSPSLLESHEKKILWRSKSFRSSSVDWSDRGSIAEGTSSLTSELDQRLRAINIKRARKMAQVFGSEPPKELYLEKTQPLEYSETPRRLSQDSISGDTITGHTPSASETTHPVHTVPEPENTQSHNVDARGRLLAPVSAPQRKSSLTDLSRAQTAPTATAAFRARRRRAVKLTAFFGVDIREISNLDEGMSPPKGSAILPEARIVDLESWDMPSAVTEITVHQPAPRFWKRRPSKNVDALQQLRDMRSS